MAHLWHTVAGLLDRFECDPPLGHRSKAGAYLKFWRSEIGDKRLSEVTAALLPLGSGRGGFRMPVSGTSATRTAVANGRAGGTPPGTRWPEMGYLPTRRAGQGSRQRKLGTRGPRYHRVEAYGPSGAVLLCGTEDSVGSTARPA